MSLVLIERDELWPYYTIKGPYKPGQVLQRCTSVVDVPDDVIASYELARKAFDDATAKLQEAIDDQEE